MKVIGQRERFGSHLGLERIQLVCDALGNPEKGLKCIHIAGTSGKGSVSALLTEVLSRSGMNVGTFTSPHLEQYNERFKINGTSIDSSTLDAVIASADRACKEVEAQFPEVGAVTEFELAAAAGFLYFHQSKVDIVVLETGLGGRLDATNVVSPILTVITTISYDHQDRLGSTLEEISFEKGGIIKAGVPIISGVQAPEAQATLKRIAAEKGAPWRSTNDVSWTRHGWNLNGGSLTFPGIGLVHTGLLGAHQLDNAATALLAITELRDLGYAISEEAISRGFKEVVWPGRLELISRKPLILLDGAHNQEGIAALAESLQHIQREEGEGTFTFLFGMMNNKNFSLLDPLIPLARRFVFSQAESGRLPAMEPSRMADYVRGHGVEAVAFEDLAEAVQEAKGTPPLCICGSLYLIGSVKRFLRPSL